MSDLLEQIGIGIGTLRNGGPMLVPLLFFSLAATAIFLERMGALKREQQIPSEYIARVYRLLERGKYDTAIALCDAKDMLVTDLLKVGIQNRDLSEGDLFKEIRAFMYHHGRRLYRNMFMMSLVSALAPLLGLLGTVLGMMVSFAALGYESGDAQLKIVANGISVALLTTFAGLVIAVPTFIAHQYLVNRADHIKRELQRYAISLVRFLKAEQLRIDMTEEVYADDRTEFEIQFETT